MARKYYQGYFKPNNPGKYKGDPTRIVYRSRWEYICMKKFDEHPDIIEWSSEEVIIPYRSPIDNRMHRYFPDFVFKKKDQSGKTQTVMVEVKPKAQTRPPKVKSGKPSKKYITEVTTWGVNEAKWKAAVEYCKDRKWQFEIITEDDIF